MDSRAPSFAIGSAPRQISYSLLQSLVLFILRVVLPISLKVNSFKMYLGFNYTENKLHRTWMPPSFDIFYCNTSRFGLQPWVFFFSSPLLLPNEQPHLGWKTTARHRPNSETVSIVLWPSSTHTLKWSRSLKITLQLVYVHSLHDTDLSNQSTVNSHLRLYYVQRRQRLSIYPRDPPRWKINALRVSREVNRESRWALICNFHAV